jgi:bis(5'-nucleosyl)-tetraphosphatase (symmetrical)
MATYVIGDVQGCYDELQRLLDKLRFDPKADRLWFTGDLVNRGPQSLAVLRYVYGLGSSAVTVLGNHDLHLVAAGVEGRARAKDTFQDVLAARDRDELLAWLRQRPLLHVENGTAMVHAGLPPQWSVETAQKLCREGQKSLARPDSDEFLLRHMYGDEPRQWTESLRHWERLRFVINCCTRLRVCDVAGRADFRYKHAPDSAPAGLLPWFSVPGRKSAGTTMLFGHWSTLGRIHWREHRAYGLDTGCVWGGKLTALTLETGVIVQVKSQQHQRPGGGD